MNKPRNRWLIAGGLLLGAAAVIAMLSMGYPTYSSLFRRLGVWLSAGLGGLFSLLPIPVSEFFIILVPLSCIFTLVWYIVKARWQGAKKALSRIFFALGLLAFVFEAGYGVHYTAPPLAQELGLEVGLYDSGQLGELTAWLLARANELAEQVPRDGEGACAFGTFDDAAKEVMAAYRTLSSRYPVFSTPRRARPKEGLFLSGMMSHLNVAGYYFPFTGEGVVSANVVDSHYPFSTAHEAAHSMGVGPEDEANFAAFLACTASGDTRLLYSGYLNAYIYASNALSTADSQLYIQVAQDRSQLLSHDLTVHRESLERFKTASTPLGTAINEAVSAAGTAINDSYIKATGQPEGIQSYGKVVDLLMAYYIKTTA